MTRAELVERMHAAIRDMLPGAYANDPECRVATAALAAIEAAGCLSLGWQPISSAPKDGTIILLFWKQDGDDIVQSGWWENGINDRCWYAADNEQCRPSDWMPLPASPLAQEARDAE